MRHLVVLFAALAAFILTAGAPSAGAAFPMQAKRVAENVYAVITPTRELPNPQNKGWNSNSAFVVTEGGVILFDTGSSTAIGLGLKSVIAGVTEKPVRWIVNSHSHGDHWLGNAVFKDTVEAIYATTQTRDKIAANGTTWVGRFDRMTKGATGRSAVLPPDTLIDGEAELVLGGVKVSFFPSGNSHTTGDLLMWLPESRVLVPGDVVYSDRMPSTGDSNLRQWIKCLGDIIAMDPAAVIPGHGKVTDLEGVKRLRSLLRAFWAAVEEGYEAGKLDYQMAADVTAALGAYSADFPGLAEKVKRDIQGVYLQVEEASFN